MDWFEVLNFPAVDCATATTRRSVAARIVAMLSRVRVFT
jgi:hypothetical protein